MINRELYFRDPTTIELLNNGISKVSEIGHDERQIKILRFELETFVCDGEYARGLERILKAYLDGLGREEQKAVWVSGFFGSGKSATFGWQRSQYTPAPPSLSHNPPQCSQYFNSTRVAPPCFLV